MYEEHNTGIYSGIPYDRLSEHEHQVILVSLVRKIWMGKLTIFHIPNGDERKKQVAQKLKSAGVLAGVWDLYILELDLWIEMKTVRGAVSEEQLEFLQKLRRAKTPRAIGWGWKDALHKIQLYIGEEYKREFEELERIV